MKAFKTTLSFVIVMLLSVAAAQAVIRKEIRLVITNGVYTDEMLVGINDGAQDAFDMYDSQKMAVNVADYPELYSFAGNQQVAINGIHTLAVGETKEVTMGYRISSAATLTIRVLALNNLDTGTVVYLKDKLLNVEKELTSASEYAFTTSKGETNNRFCLIIKRNEVAQPISTTPVVIDTVVTAPIVIAPVVTEPVVVPEVSTSPDFNVLVSSARTLEVQIVNLIVKGTKITVNSITGRRILSVSATGDVTNISTPLSKGQYIVTVNNKSFTKSKNIIVN